MPTFVLKKYAEENPVEKQEQVETNEQNEQTPEKEITVAVSGSISEIVANALNKVLVNKKVEIEEKPDEEGITVQAVSTEDINNKPLETLRSVKGVQVLLIATEGFHTREEEWFLTNIKDQVGKVFYTVESFVDYISKELETNE